jgi:hypothetical protein
MHVTHLIFFAALFGLLVLAFAFHISILGSGSGYAFIWNIEQAKDISTALGLFSAIFSGFAAFGLLYTIFLQNKSHQLQNKQIQQSTALQVRMLHLELLKLSIADEHLAAVWDSSGGEDGPPPSGRQSMYVNLILSHWEMMFTSNLLNDATLRTLVSERMGGLMMHFWEKNRDFRRKHAEGQLGMISGPNTGLSFHQLVDDAYLERKTRFQKRE